MTLPDLIVHCDWGSSPSKRWFVKARRLDRHAFGVGEPEPLERVETFFSDLARSSRGPVFAGFDFPIGLPRKYTDRVGITRFPEMLLQFGEGLWKDFYTPAERRQEITLNRPFYPRAPGGTKKQDLLDGLGLPSGRDLLRRCDQSALVAGTACEIFWTLGANQCGKGAILGWREVLAPAMRRNEISLWPFDGDLVELLGAGKITVGEVYPTVIYPKLGIARNFGKTNQGARAVQARAIVDWCDRNDLALSPRLREDLRSGFGDTTEGEDKFDALVGVLGMIQCSRSLHGPSAPTDSEIRNVEGWMLGLEFEHGGGATDLGQAELAPGATRAADHAQFCPACNEKLFKRWPWGWDGHAAEKCKGITGATREERKRNYKEKYLVP